MFGKTDNSTNKNYSVGYLDISFAMSKNPITDDVLLYTSVSAIKNSVKNLVLTKVGDVLFNPYFGLNVDSYLFTIVNTTNTTELIKKITDIITTYEPRVRLNTIEVETNYSNLDLTVSISFFIVGQPPNPLSVTFVLVREQ